MKAPHDTGANWVLRLLVSERARDLGRRLRLPVLVHELGWRSTEIEVEITRRANGSIVPMRVLMGRAAMDLLMVDADAVHGRCERYNRVIGQLRYLAKQLADLAPKHPEALRPGSPIVYARAMLATFDELVARRERSTMANGAIRLATLDVEIAYFTRYYACLAPTVERFTGGAPAPAASSAFASLPDRRRRRSREGCRDRDRRLETMS